MSHINFWKQWHKNYRSAYYLLLCVFILSLLCSFYSQFSSADLAYPLEEVRKTQSIDLSIHNIYDFVFELDVPTRNYIIFQGFLSLSSGFNDNISYIFLTIIFLSFSLLLAASTYFSRLWFIIFQSVFVVWVITMKLQYLKLFGVDSQLFTFLIIGLLLIIGYVFHAFKTGVSLLFRWFSFGFVLSILLVLVYWKSPVADPVIFLTHHSIIVPVLLSFIFIFNVSYEIILHILYVLAGKRNQDGSSNLWHFVILSLLYLVYVSLTFARNKLIVQWDIVYLDEFVLLAISAVLGIWGFRKRSELFAKQLPFRPLGGYLYLLLGVITFSTIAWIFANGNDPLVETFEDIIVFSHLGFGSFFLIYVIYNFVGLLKEGVGIYPVVFKPVNIPYYLVRLVGFAIVIILILQSSYLPYYQAVSGYYNSLADYYAHSGNRDAAKTTYKIARQYAFTNHKSNFAIGQMEYEEKKWAEASSYFKQAGWKKPTVQAYVNRAQAQLNAGLYFEALFTMNDAQKDFPDNVYVLNTTGLIYEQLNQTDSSYIYFDAASRAAGVQLDQEIADANKLALLAKNKVNEEVSSDIDLGEKSVPYQANYIALANQKRISLDNFRLDPTTISPNLGYNDFSMLFNYTLNKSLTHKPFEEDTILWLAKRNENEDFYKSINYAAAVRQNYAGNQKEAFSKIYELENSEISDAGFYYFTHGLWLYEQGAYELAEEKFQEAERLKVSGASTLRVINLIRAGRLYEAAKYYQNQFEGNVVDAAMLEQDPLFQFLQGNTAQLPESFLYLWLSTNESLQEVEKDSLISELERSPFLKLYQLDRVEEKIENKQLSKAWDILSSIQIAETEKGLIELKNNLTALLVVMSDRKTETDQVKQGDLAVYPKNYKLLFEAYLAKLNNDSLAADKLMWRLGDENVFFENGVIIASEYFRNKGEQEKAYNFLVEAARLNVNNTLILKEYTLQALRMNLGSYASESLEELRLLLTDEEFERFEKVYEEIKINNTPEAW
ncbi:hypothetical protein C9994_01080 [Marivirga lumbricoides]|uniref:Uncharacterized protein n=1 Tax=Marivirga lumbricoides TaxID=1046115 RepID=A0A2T4DVL2_9BACT|nr:hypothetical protein C9994_01080 [Marivirga lumbricoides]